MDPFAPTPKQQRGTDLVNVRLRDAGHEWLRARQAEHSVSRSEVVKAALAFAAARPVEFAALIEERKK